jgi:hypothetical protein
VDDQAGVLRGLGNRLGVGAVGDRLHLDAVESDGFGEGEAVVPGEFLWQHRHQHRALERRGGRRLGAGALCLEPGGKRQGRGRRLQQLTS